MTLADKFSLVGKRVWVTGHNGMVGSALMRRLARESCEILTVSRTELDLTRQAPVEDWVSRHRPDVVFMAAGRVGGIQANTAHPGGFLYDNTVLEINVIEAARKAGVQKLIQLGSSSIYPRITPQPIPESALLTSPLEPSNEAYAVAKIANLKMGQAYRSEYGCDFITAVLTNLYGPGDHFDLAGGHVLPSLIRKAHDARASGAHSMDIWGTGTPRREFLHVDDCADALVFLMCHYSAGPQVNVGSGSDVSILELTRLVARIVGFEGEIRTDPSKPDGIARKLMSTELLNGMGWRSSVTLEDGIARTYRWYLDNIDRLRGT